MTTTICQTRESGYPFYSFLWIPVCTGMTTTTCHSRESGYLWIPAFAGMTGKNTKPGGFDYFGFTKPEASVTFIFKH
jgi:hypothetical protein